MKFIYAILLGILCYVNYNMTGMTGIAAVMLGAVAGYIVAKVVK